MNLFGNDALSKAVNETLATVPDGHKNAVVTTVNDHGVEVVAAFQKDTSRGTWLVTGSFQHAWTGDNTLGVKATVSW